MPKPAAPELELFDEAFQRRLRALSLVARRAPAGSASGDGTRRSRAIGRGSEFADYREYSSGDDYRHVDWNAYARSERLLVRQHQHEVELSVYLLLDCSASMATGNPPKLRYAQQLTAALACLGLQRFDRVSIVALRDRVLASLAPARGPQGVLPALAFLRTLDAHGPTDLNQAVRAFAASNPRQGLAILISDLFDPAGPVHAIDRLRRARFETRLIQLVDPGEREPSLRGDFELVDAETGRARSISITPELIARYVAARQREAQALARACSERQVPLHVIDTRTSPEEAVLRLLRRGGMIR